MNWREIKERKVMKSIIPAKKHSPNNCRQQQKCARREVAITGEGVNVNIKDPQKFKFALLRESATGRPRP
jgi:hypothetical protein